MSRQVILDNIIDALADEHSLEREGNALRIIAEQLRYAGVEVTVADLREALDAVSETCPSAFGPQPILSTHYSPWGKEYRLRHPQYDAARECVKALYKVTDTLDRNGGDTTRPRAFAVARAHLRVRWAQGNFAVPDEDTIRQWIAPHI